MTSVKGPIISFADLPSIEAYLSAHEGSQTGFWLKLAKAGAPEATITKAAGSRSRVMPRVDRWSAWEV